jgi:hypothetical protein
MNFYEKQNKSGTKNTSILLLATNCEFKQNNTAQIWIQKPHTLLLATKTCSQIAVKNLSTKLQKYIYKFLALG